MNRLNPWMCWTVIALSCATGCSEDPAEGGEIQSPDTSASHDGGTQRDATVDAAPDAGPAIYEDFPATPDVRDALPADLPDKFAVPNQDGPSPCLSEPPLGALLPKNWTAPFFEWTGARGLNVYELRLRLPNQSADYVVYTTQTRHELPADIWSKVEQHSAGMPMRVSLRGAQLDAAGTLTRGPILGADGDLLLAPVSAEGTIVYWTTSGGSALKGFEIGQLTPSFVFSPTDLARDGEERRCVGCHTSTPDGLAAIATFSKSATAAPFEVDGVLIDGSNTAVGENLRITSYALSLLRRPSQSAPAFSAALYGATSAMVVTVLRNSDTASRHELVWTNLRAQANGWGILARSGDPRQAAFPNLSHDGLTVAYTSSEEIVDGRTGALPVDIYTVPFNGGAGGAAVPVAGASSPDFQELYPAYSPDDRLLAFNRSLPGKSYNSASAEIFVVPTNRAQGGATVGGEAIRIAGNDPPACTNRKSPGLTNSWARWSPTATRVDGKTYYWLTFSSRRRAAADGKVLPQLYVSGVVLSEDGTVTTYPAVYVRSQVETESNHTPAWDVFDISIL